MYIVVLADTHIPKKAKVIPKTMENDLKKADLIIHAGDWQVPEVAEELRKYAPVEGVTGNVDNDKMCKLFPKKRKIEADGFFLGVTHGDGKSKTTEQRALEVFKNEAIDILIFGHSHIPVLREHDNTILFNPGSPTDKRRQKQYSYGIIETGNNLNVKHVYFDSK